MRLYLRYGVLAGLLVFLGLFGLGVVDATRLSYMGGTDERWVGIILGRYAGEVVRFQGLLLALQLAIGASLGAAAALVRAGLWPLLRCLGRSRAAILLTNVGIVLLVHGLALGWGIARRPVGYAEWLYEQGRVRAWLQLLAAALVRGEPLPERPIRTVGRFYRAVRWPDLKYIRHEVRLEGVWRAEGVEELCDLAADPAEYHDIAPLDHGRLERARAEFEQLEAEAARPVPVPAAAGQEKGGERDLHLDQGVDPEVMELLGEWGYL